MSVSPAILYGLVFLVASAVLFFLVKPLTKTTDRLGQAFGLSRLFLGVILLSSITSLPEAATSLASLWPVQSPDLAIGNVLGSNIFNLAVIPMLAVLYRKNYLYRVDNQHIIAGFGVLMLGGLVGWGLAVPPTKLGLPEDPFFHPVTLLVLAGYGITLYLTHHWPMLKPESEEQPVSVFEVSAPASRWPVLIQFIGLALAVVGLGVALAFSGDGLARTTGLGQTFFGTLFLAAATSLPEVLICWSALKSLGAVNLAVGNITGSCLFNLGILGLFDLLFPGNLYAVVDPAHMITLLGGVLMMALAGFAMLLRPHKPARNYFPPEMWLLTLTYLVTLYLIY